MTTRTRTKRDDALSFVARDDRAHVVEFVTRVCVRVVDTMHDDARCVVVVTFVRTQTRTRTFAIDVQRTRERRRVERFVIVVAHVVERDRRFVIDRRVRIHVVSSFRCVAMRRYD